jgi:hypothetical protein
VKLSFKGREYFHQEFAVCMAFAAFRLCLFGNPAPFTKREVIAWINATAKTATQGDGE